MKYELWIPKWRPLLLNRMLYKPWQVVRRMKHAEHSMIGGYFMQAGIPPAAGKRRVSLRITLKPRAKESDDDALWKGLLDGLKQCGAIKDDNRQWLDRARDVEYQRGTADDWGTCVILEDVES